ncbi:FAD-dependent monooxygenase [Actinoplanes teichomyceticus]|uniref:2-polyprenyl-6-methoxyphenol hydroxylase-like FAD-dependent oxidoreductase n=1 Tax=Actinoplanes teichomyceticus TaxID=1867 RepID=A0A561WAM3_ACTTI|nr:FAD-dependent monooxygenase [Actinoplanes teichomyceticus]TWG20914.1 2-polyprenyl-6-methoxyphenol hydroxylase-like FAD-dependent oxidoreductase [Actinoplanes teichomyceticus]GIF16500.1 FAD-binding monooxygenase [Actinoplanes teichomyceticus]
MRITCVGGGPAGLYFAVLAKLADPRHRITVLERDPAGVTYGWGVVFWDDLLDDLFRHDPVSAARIVDAACGWDEYEVRATGKPVTHLGGYGFSLGRHRLLEILGERARQLGVEVRYEAELADPAALPPADLVVACDGAGSRIRDFRARHFGTRIETGRNKYIWLGTPHVFRTFTFGFERTEAGWIWFHAYPFTDRASTFIAECPPETWTGLGLDRLDPADGCARLREIFSAHLDGRPLDHAGRGWRNFRRITAERWDHGNVVLMGDAAHTTHFAIGSGTKLAMQDAMALADAIAGGIADGTALSAALERYEHRRRVALAPLQRAARASSAWFERMPEYADLPARRFSYALSNRRGEYPAWRYLLHMSTQGTAGRTMLRWTLSARRWHRARRRPAGRLSAALS